MSLCQAHDTRRRGARHSSRACAIAYRGGNCGHTRCSGIQSFEHDTKEEDSTVPDEFVKSMANREGQSAVVAVTMADDERIYETVNMPMVKQARGPAVKVAQKTAQDNERDACQDEVWHSAERSVRQTRCFTVTHL